jgi:hypothetical protein
MTFSSAIWIDAPPRNCLVRLLGWLTYGFQRLTSKTNLQRLKRIVEAAHGSGGYGIQEM